MPRYAPDIPLQLHAAEYVRITHDGVVKRAASALNVDYIMLRRFLVAGRASPENRQKVRDALNAKGLGVAKELKISHEMPIEATRSMLAQLLEALDALQSKPSQTSDGAI